MPLVPLSNLTLSMLADGLTGKMIDHELAGLARDIEERGSDGKPRTLTIKYTIVPESPSLVTIDAEVKPGVPALRTPPTQARIGTAPGGYGFAFRDDNAGNVDQQTFRDLDDGRDA